MPSITIAGGGGKCFSGIIATFVNHSQSVALLNTFIRPLKCGIRRQVRVPHHQIEVNNKESVQGFLRVVG